MDVANLQVAVSSTGIADTSRALGGLGKSAENAATKVDKLTSSVEKLITKNADLSTATAKATAELLDQNTAFNTLITVTANIAASMNAVVTASSSLTAALTQLNGATLKATESQSNFGSTFTSTLKAMATAVVVYKGLEFAKNIVETGDAMQNLNSRLVMVTGSQHDATLAMNKMFDAAQQSRMSFEGMLTLFARMDPAIKKMGGDSNDTVTIVKGAANALKLYGASATEAQGAILQLSHAFASGQLNGREYNAMAQEGRPLLDALVVGYNSLHAATQIHFSDLKDMVSKHKVTTEDLAAGIKIMGDTWQKEVDAMPITFTDAVTRVKNAWDKSIGEMNMATGFNGQLSKAVDILQEMIPVITQGIGNAFVNVMMWIDRNREGIQKVWDEITGLASDLWTIITDWGKIVGSIADADKNASLLSDSLLLVRFAVADISDGFKVIVGSIVLALGYAGKLAGMGFHHGADQEREQQFKDGQARADAMIDAGKQIFANLVEQGSAVDNLIAKEKTLAATRAAQKEQDAQEKFRAGENLGGFQAGKGIAESPKTDEAALRKINEELQKYKTLMMESTAATQAAELTLQAMAQYGPDYDKITAGQKKVLALQLQIADLQKNHAAQSVINAAIDALGEAQAESIAETKVEDAKKQIEQDKKMLDQEDAKIVTLQRESDALTDKINNYHQLSGAVESVHIAETQSAIDNLKAQGELSAAQQEMLDKLEKELSLRKELQDKKISLGGEQAQAELDKMLDPKKAEKFGNALKDAFGNAGKALGTLMDTFTKYQERQAQLAKQEQDYQAAKASGAISEAQLETDLDNIRQKSTQDELDSIAAVAGATKDFFDKKTAAYKLMDGIEKAYRAAQLALDIEAFVQKSGLISALTALFVTGKATEITTDEASTDVQLGLAMQRASANAVVGISNQAQGDPYTAFPRMAAMAAAMIALGIAVHGMSGTASAPTYNTGTGTVLGGSPTDVSKSIENSIGDLKGIDSMTMKYSAQMAASLQNIESELGGVANLVFQGGTLNTGSNLGISTGSSRNMGDPIASKLGLGGLATLGWNDVPVFGQFITALQGLWGKTTRDISAAGVAINGTLQQLMAGGGMQQFADVKTTSSSFFGLKKSTSYDTQLAALDPQMQQQFSLIFSSITDEIGQAAQALGQPLDTIQQKLNGFVLNLGKIDLKGLSGKDLQDRLAAVFGAAGDTIARAALPGFEAFQKVGEGYLETVTRVASGYEQAKAALNGLGMSMIDLASVVNKQGDVGAELVRQTIEIKESGSGIGQIMDTLQGTASDLVSAYKQLIDLRNQMSAVNLGTNLTSDLIAAAGGVQSMSAALKSYSENFFTDSERQAAAVKQLSVEFQALGLQMPATKESFRALVDQLEGQGNTSLAMQVIGLADAFSQVADASTSVQSVSDAQSALNDAYNTQKQTLENLKSTFDDFTKSLGDFRNNLMTGDLSPLSPEEKYATIAAQYDSVSQAALSGDQDAISEYQNVAQQFLQASQQYNASGDQYMQDYQKVLDQTQAIMDASEGQSSIAQQQLDALDQQVGSLIQINTSVLSVSQAIENLQTALTANAVVAPVTTGSNAGVNAPTAGINSVAPIANSIDALSTQVQALTQTTVQSAQAIVGATYDSNAQNAQTIVNGTNDVYSKGGYAQSRVPVALA